LEIVVEGVEAGLEDPVVANKTKEAVPEKTLIAMLMFNAIDARSMVTSSATVRRRRTHQEITTLDSKVNQVYLLVGDLYRQANGLKAPSFLSKMVSLRLARESQCHGVRSVLVRMLKLLRVVGLVTLLVIMMNPRLQEGRKQKVKVLVTNLRVSNMRLQLLFHRQRQASSQQTLRIVTNANWHPQRAANPS